MKITKKDLQLSMALIGILAAVFSYFFVFVKLNEKTEILKADNIALKQQADFLEQIYVNKDKYEADAADMSVKMDDIIAKYDVGHVPQDDIMYLYNMESMPNNSIMVNSMNMSNAEIVLPEILNADQQQPAEATTATSTTTTEATPADATATDAAQPAENPMSKYELKLEDNGIAMYRVPLDYSFLVSYEGFKNVVDYIYGVGGNKNIESFSLAFDANTGVLNGNMKMNMYYLTGTEKVYTKPMIPSTSTGVNNIFRTIETGQTSDGEEVEEETTIEEE